MPSLEYLRLTDKLACQTAPATYGVLRTAELVTARDTKAIEDQEALDFSFSRLDATGEVRAIAAQLRAGRVIAAVWSDGTIDEWRVGTITRGRGGGGIIRVACVPLWLDLIERADSAAGKGWVSDVVAGERNFEYEITERTASSILSTYVIPNLPSWITLGTVDPTYVIPSLAVVRLTPGALAIQVRDALRSVDVACELRLRRNGTTDYKLDLVTEIGASGATPIFHPRNSLKSLEEKQDATLQATRVLVKGSTDPDGAVGALGRARWKGAAPVGLAIALSDRNGGASPIAFDNQFVGMYLLRVKTGRTFAITASSATAGTVTLGGGVSTIAADEDFELRVTEPLTNTRTPSATRHSVTAIAGSTLTLGASLPIDADSQFVDWYARIWSLAAGGVVILTTRISASVAATDVITVASVAGVTTAHHVEFIQLDGAGEIPTLVDHPTFAAADPVGYGVKAMELSKPQQGVAQLGPNAWLRTWTNAANPPDGWTFSGTAGSTSQNTNAAYTRYGGKSWAFDMTGLRTALMRTPAVYPNYDSGHTALSCRAWVYFSTYTNLATWGSYSELVVHALTATGGLGTILGNVRVKDSAATVTATVVGAGAWIELAINGITLGPTTAPYGVAATFSPVLAGNQVVAIGYLDAIEWYPFAACPSSAMEFGDATGLLQAANNQLRLVASPPLYYQFGIADLERAFPEEYDWLAITLGANARAADVEYGVDATVRVLRIDRDLLNPSDTKLTLANRPTSLTALQSAGTSTQRRVIAAVVAGEVGLAERGAAYVALTGATTLPSEAEIATASAGAPIVTLGPDSAVTYQPASAASPSTGVTSGTPPSRRFNPNTRALY